MPFDPNLPQENTLIDAVQMRGQLNGLLNTLSQCSSNSNGVNTLDTPMPDPDMESLRQKLNELIHALRR